MVNLTIGNFAGNYTLDVNDFTFQTGASYIQPGENTLKYGDDGENYVTLTGEFSLGYKRADKIIQSVSGVSLTVDGSVILSATGLDMVGADFTGKDESIAAYFAEQVVTITGNSSANNITGGAFGDVMYGYGGNDKLNGNDGNDTLYGDARPVRQGAKVEAVTGADTLNGNDGNDMLYGGLGNDKLNGGNDNDTLSGDAGDDKLSGDAGKDTIRGGDGKDTISGGEGDDKLYGNAGDDKVDAGDGNDQAWGGAGADTLSGKAGNDKLYGEDGNDILGGDVGNDFLFGGLGVDKLDGSVGVDYLNGGKGNDLLIGGAGNDYFIFIKGDGKDVIKDFDAVGKDHDFIDLSDYAGVDSFKSLHFVKSGSNVIIDLPGTDEILLQHVSIKDLDKADFVF